MRSFIWAAALCVSAGALSAANEIRVESTAAAAGQAEVRVRILADNDAPLTALFGDEHKVKLFDPDPAAAKANRARIVESMQTLRVLKEPAADRRILVIGANAWPVPFPIVKTGDRWRFATEEGIEELIMNRLVHEEPLGRGADLAREVEGGADRAGGGDLDRARHQPRLR